MNNSYWDYLEHHGIFGQRKGHRNGPPYPLDPATDYSATEKKLNRIDKRWVRQNDKKIRKYATNTTRNEMREYEKELSKQTKKYNSDGKISKNYATAYNKKLASLMNQSISGLEAPSGRVVQFIAKRGEIGVYTALADKSYDFSQVKNGVYASGKVAYRNEKVSQMEVRDKHGKK